MKRITLTDEIELDVPATTAWEVVADYARDPEWRTGVVAMVPDPGGPVRPGTTTAEELRLAGQTWRSDGLVTDVDDGRSFRWRTTSGADAHGARAVVPLGAVACRVRLELEVTPHGPERLLAPLLARLLRRNLRRDLERLREVVDAQRGVDAVATQQPA